MLDFPGLVKEADLYADPDVAKRASLEHQKEVCPTLHSFDAIAVVKRKAGKVYSLFSCICVQGADIR